MSAVTGTSDAASSNQRPRSRSKSPRAFRSLAHGIRGLLRVQFIAEDGLPASVNASAIVQRIALTLASTATYKKVAGSLFDKWSIQATAWGGGADAGENSASGGAQPTTPSGKERRVLPTSRVPDILQHWDIPEETGTPLFWAVLRKQESTFEAKVLPKTISFEDFSAVLLKVLRRVRDKYCEIKVSRGQYLSQNPKQLLEEYSMQGSCGSGAFGECFWVQHIVSKKRRVCKRIHKDQSSVPEEELTSELETLKMLDHPCILRFFEWFESDDTYFLILEAALGGDLKKLLARAREASQLGLDEAFVREAAEQGSRGLAYIHSMRVIHRDVKPANLLLATEDLGRPRVLLADFGVSELFRDHSQQNGQMRGSIAYMAPEVFANMVSPRSDVWALGIVVYELLAGQRPWVAENAMVMYQRLKTKDLSLEPVLTAKGSSEAAEFIKYVLVKSDAERPSAAQVLEHAWLGAVSKGSAPTGRQARMMRNSLSGFSGMKYFPRAVMNCIASQLDTSKIEGLADAFESFDSDADGRLSCAEVAAGLAELGVTPDAITQLIDAMDMNSDGQVQYSEFVASLIQTQSKLVEDVLYHAFELIDVNRDGSICVEELRGMLSGDGPLAAVLPDGQSVEQVVRDVDTSRDGKISFPEFKAYLLRQVGSGTSPGSDLGINGLAGAAAAAGASEPPVGDEELLEVTLARLSQVVNRPEKELLEQAHRLSQVHWLTTVGDLRSLQAEDWPRLGLPLKLERALRAYATASL